MLGTRLFPPQLLNRNPSHSAEQDVTGIKIQSHTTIYALYAKINYISPCGQIMIFQLLLSPVHLPRAELNKRLNKEKNMSDKLTGCIFLTFLYCPLLKIPLLPLGLTLTYLKQTTQSPNIWFPIFNPNKGLVRNSIQNENVKC